MDTAEEKISMGSIEMRLKSWEAMENCEPLSEEQRERNWQLFLVHLSLVENALREQGLFWQIADKQL